jgi:hypothetical protein
LNFHHSRDILEDEVGRGLTEDVRPRVRSALHDEPAPEPDALHDLMTDGCARMLTLETERLQLSARISELAADANEPSAARELRRLWARRLAIRHEHADLRGLLGKLRSAG